MKDFTINTDTKITLYIKECFGCDRNNKYSPLRQFILEHQVKLQNFIVKRIELSPDWQKEAFNFEMELPILVFENKNDGKMVITYSEFLYKLKKGVSAKPRSKAKGAVSGRVADGTSSQDDAEIKNGNDDEKDG